MINTITKHTKNFSYYIFGFIFTLLLVLIGSSPLFQQVNNLIVDRLQGVNPPRDEIVIVGIDDASLQAVGAWPWDWSVIAKMVNEISKNSPAVVSLDVLLLEAREGRAELEAAISSDNKPVVLASKLTEDGVIKPDLNSDKMLSGFVNFSTDLDGKIRRTFVGQTLADGSCEPSFAAKIFALYTKSDPDFCAEQLKIRNLNAVKTTDGSLLFTYSDQQFNRISAKDVLAGKYSESTFRDKIVLIGSTAIDLRSNLNDNFFSVTGQALPGIEIHANILNTFLNNQFHTEISAPVLFVSVSILNLLTAILYRKTKSSKQDLFILMFVLISTTVFGVAMFEFKINWGIIFTVVAVTANYFFMLAFKYLTERMQRQFITQAFGMYLNPRLLEQLENKPELLKLGGMRKEMTVFFSDIRGFTAISEKLSAANLIEFLNSYLGRASEVILRNDGTIDKFVGDAIMSFWNAPLPDPLHRKKAIKSAFEITGTLEEFNKQFGKDVPHLAVGIGINTGDAVVGNIGSEYRLDYTVLGDTVNVASRLEGLTKMYQVQIIVSKSTLEGVDLSELKLIARLLDRITVKGRKKPVEIYQVMENTEENQKIKEIYEAGFAAYQAKDFETAKRFMKKLINTYKDGASTLLYHRFTQIKKLTDWDGVWHWEEK